MINDNDIEKELYKIIKEKKLDINDSINYFLFLNENFKINKYELLYLFSLTIDKINNNYEKSLLKIYLNNKKTLNKKIDILNISTFEELKSLINNNRNVYVLFENINDNTDFYSLLWEHVHNNYSQ